MDKSFTGTLMTEGNLRRQIIFFALPVFVGNLFQQMYNTVHTAMALGILCGITFFYISSIEQQK